ncbi:MAG: chromosome segregation protein SMC [Pseudomonadota bacterium]
MRLSTIKLAGFKSFVDPTSIPMPSQLVGVVGPNGCGKSNVIDAVRWVMGESSARHLRGEAMADVIFNGSSSRKPVGQASVELVFDNSDGGAGGQYAHYNEIAVRRVVTRDGQSNYYLNGTRCRRRDITDIFLGTGLGPRSYAIIQQNTVSRLIEARPEEMRTFLEEAAGISKYKERRRETENRIRHTRENMERLEDLREELDRQLAHLQRQAKTAERYKELKARERELRGQLQVIRWRVLDDECAEHDRAVGEKETEMEAEVARQRHLEAELETRRGEQGEAADAFSEIQGRYYAVGSDIARLEEAIQHARERREQQERDLAQLDTAWEEAEAHLGQDRERLETTDAALAEGEPELEQLEAAEAEAREAVTEAEEALQTWQTEWEAVTADLAEPTRTADVARNTLHNLERNADEGLRRQERLEAEQRELDTTALDEELHTIATERAEAEAGLTDLQKALETAQGELESQREGNRAAARVLDEQRQQLQQSRGRHASLEALQQAALGKDNGAVSQWLERQGLGSARRLAEGLDVEAGWGPAVEAVLGDSLEAVCVDGLDPLARAVTDLTEGGVTLLDTGGSGRDAGPDGATLAGKVHAPWDVAPLLAGVRVADDLAAALALREQLTPGESVVTRDGLWLGPNWLRVRRDQDERGGVLEREEALREVAATMERLEEQLASGDEALEAGRHRESELEQERDRLQSASNEQHRRVSELRSRQQTRQSRLEQLRSRAEQIEQEIGERIAEREANAEEQEAVREQLNEALERSEVLAARRDALAERREPLQRAVEEARQRHREAGEAVNRQRLHLQGLRTERASIQQALERLEGQRQQFSERRDELQRALAEEDDPVEHRQAELDRLLTQRQEVEAAMVAARERSEAVDQAIRELSQQRTEAEQNATRLREEVERARMSAQELRVRRESLLEQIQEAGHDRDALLADLPEDADEARWQQSLQEVETAISRLGSINLAAIDEYEQQSERKVYLDQQREDLVGALETLEDAIRKIDRETRTRFKETYDRVNDGLKGYFPRLFKGGHAYLELTGDDLLDSGVTVMARPPGKQNSSIHQLSGGEKALTAVALVFSFFQLNPSPFCMLDEVDAPLDDANVGRFCELVREMSERTQFILITHNKVTMEMAEQLNGITMNEPGVSRLVSVDVDEAASMAKSA